MNWADFIHKGLCKFYASGSTAGIPKKHEKKLRFILANLINLVLDQAEDPVVEQAVVEYSLKENIF